MSLCPLPVDEDTGAGYAKAAIESHQPVGLDRLDVDVHDTRELTLAAWSLSIHPESCSAKYLFSRILQACIAYIAFQWHGF